MFGSYRRTEANDPDIYVAAIATVLSGYDEELIREVTDPRSGISTQGKFQAFPPNSGELREYCEQQMNIRRRIKTYNSLPPVNFNRPRLPAPDPETRPPGWRANLRVPQTAPRYDAMVERSKTAHRGDWCWMEEGIKVPLDWYASPFSPPNTAERPL